MSIYTTVALPKLLKQICAMEMKGKTCAKIKKNVQINYSLKILKEKCLNSNSFSFLSLLLAVLLS